MTVSMALRNNPRIALATRRRLQRLARQQGYRPDPAINRLMLHIRSRKSRRLLQGSICALLAKEWGNVGRVYPRAILESARKRAESSGFVFDCLGLEELTATPARFRRVLRARGVEGLLLMPLPAPMNLSEDLAWENFSVVAATYSVLKPDFHRVVPHQFNNALLICQKLAKAGFQRIGLIMDATYEERVHHHSTAAVSWQSLFGGTEFVRPLLLQRFEPETVKKWIQEERPDSVIVSESSGAFELQGLLGSLSRKPPAIVCTSWAAGQPFAGIDERPTDIANRAVDLLASMILRNEKGIPPVPAVTMVDGRWRGDVLL